MDLGTPYGDLGPGWKSNIVGSQASMWWY